MTTDCMWKLWLFESIGSSQYHETKEEKLSLNVKCCLNSSELTYVLLLFWY